MRGEGGVAESQPMSRAVHRGGDSHLEISVIPMLGDPLYSIHVSTGLVPEPGKDLWLICQCKGGHIKANEKLQRRWVSIARPLNTQHSGDFNFF